MKICKRFSDKIDDQEDDVRMQDAVNLKVIKQVLADKRVSASEAQYALANERGRAKMIKKFKINN